MEHLARMRTLDAAYEMLKAEDPDTAISKYYLRYLMLSGHSADRYPYTVWAVNVCSIMTRCSCFCKTRPKQATIHRPSMV